MIKLGPSHRGIVGPVGAYKRKINNMENCVMRSPLYVHYTWIMTPTSRKSVHTYEVICLDVVSFNEECSPYMLCQLSSYI